MADAMCAAAAGGLVRALQSTAANLHLPTTPTATPQHAHADKHEYGMLGAHSRHKF